MSFKNSCIKQFEQYIILNLKLTKKVMQSNGKVLEQKPFKISNQFKQTDCEGPKQNVKTYTLRLEDKQTKKPTLRAQGQQGYQKKIVKCFIISHVLTKISNNKCFYHNYLMFYIPAILMTGFHLSMYSSEKELQAYSLFTLFIKKVSQIMKKESKQLSDEEIINYLTIALNYKKNALKVNEALKQFLSKHEKRVKSTLPVYYEYFKMVSKLDEKLPQKATIKDGKALIEQTENSFKIINNKDL